MKIGFKKVAVTTVLAVGVSPAALAQSVDNPFARGRHQAVTERSQPEFNPEPIRSGAFEIWSSLGATAEYNDNIYIETDDPDDDTIIRIQPSVDVRSNWSVHELNLGANVSHNEYISNDSETTTDYNAYLGGRLDVRRTFSFNGRIDAAHVTEERWEPGSLVGAEPNEYDTYSARVGANYRVDRFSLSGEVGQGNQDFERTAQRFRDNEQTWISGRASYAVSPDVAIFVQARRTELDYDFTPVGALNRDGTRTSVQAGVNFELAAPFRGEIAVGSQKEEKDDPALDDVDGLNVDARLMWFPTRLTTVTFRGSRGFVDPGVASTPTAANTYVGARVDHEFMRNVLVFGDLNYTSYDFENLDREDKKTDFAIGFGYKLNKRAHAEASYRLQSQESNGVAADPTRRSADQNVFAVGIRVFP